MRNRHRSPEALTTRCRAVLRNLALAAALASITAPAAVAQAAPPAGGGSAAPGTGGEWFRPEPGVDAASLKRALGEGEISGRWIYHDLAAARGRARESGRPIVAVFRCVPCGSAPGLDGAVCTAGGAAASAFEAQIRAAGGELDALLDNFVAVRVVKMNGVNRRVFAFDRDVPYVAVFLNADGVVYGRYGTRDSPDRKQLPHLNLPSFQQALRRALDLHRGYPGNRDQLAAAAVEDKAPALTEAMPTFEPFPEKYNPAGVKNCIHCHTVGEAEVRQTLAEGRLAQRDLWPFPAPRNLGLDLDRDDGLKVRSVSPGSPAAEAGVEPGDVIGRVAGRFLTSEADIRWALHHAPDKGVLLLTLRRGGREVEAGVKLAGPWRRGRTHWRASVAPLRPNVHLRPDPYRERKGAAPGQMGLEVRYPRGPAARAGLRNGDLLVAVDGRTDLHLEADVLHYLHFVRPGAAEVECTIIRKGVRSTVTLPVR